MRDLPEPLITSAATHEATTHTVLQQAELLCAGWT